MEVSNQNKWNQFLRAIEKKIGAERFKEWFSDTKLLGFEGNHINIGLPSQFVFEKYEDEFYDVITSTLRKIYGEEIKLDYVVSVIKNDDSANIKYTRDAQASTGLKTKKETKSSRAKQSKIRVEQDIIVDPQLNKALTLDNYCVGNCNLLPVTIAKYIAENPGKREFNPFFLYGDVGVGKTHLLQAIGNKIVENYPKSKVLYLPMKQFQFLYTEAFFKEEIPAFINWFQTFDVLLFDDIQELSSKSSGTINALFPIFNHLYMHNKVLAFTSDCPPAKLEGYTDRLIDRFYSGITEQLQKPDLELRKKILYSKAVRNGLNISDDVLDVIAENTSGSVRELESIVMSLLTRSISLSVPITKELAKSIVGKYNKKRTKSVNFDKIVKVTTDYFNLTPEVIYSNNKVRDVAEARQIIMYLADKILSLSSTAIGQKLKRRHTTVLHGIKTIKDRHEICDPITAAVETIESRLI